MDVGWDAAPVVGDGHRTIGVEADRDAGRIASERLVNGIIDDFIDHMMKAGAVIGIADIHAWPLADGIETAQHLDRIGAIVSVCFRGQRERRHGGGFGHGLVNFLNFAAMESSNTAL